jgi:hypothetical protein
MQTTDTTTTNRRRPLTPWELPALLTPMHTYRRSHKKTAQDRPHFASVLAYVQRNRFVVASQVQRRFPEQFRSERTLRRHLEEMETLGYLATAPARAVGPLFPKVFYITGRGNRKLREAFAARGKAWEPATIDRRGRHSREGYSAEHVIHELFISEFLLGVWQTVQGRPDLELLTIQRRSLAKHPAFEITEVGRPTRLQPDALFLFRQVGGGMVCCFVEIDRGTMNVRQITAKFRRYATWARSDSGQSYLIELYRRHGATDPRPNFRILLVADDRNGSTGNDRMVDLITATLSQSAAIREKCWFTTIDDLREHQHDDLPLDAPVWIRARGIDPGDPSRPSVGGDATLGLDRRTRAAAHSSLRDHAERVIRHSLFPKQIEAR